MFLDDNKKKKTLRKIATNLKKLNELLFAIIVILYQSDHTLNFGIWQNHSFCIKPFICEIKYYLRAWIIYIISSKLLKLSMENCEEKFSFELQISIKNDEISLDFRDNYLNNGDYKPLNLLKNHF